MTEPLDLFNPEHYAAVRLPAERAAPLPNWCYTSRAWYRAEVERIFMKAWNYVGHASQVPDPGSYFTRDITGMPIIVVRGEDGEIRAFHNACRHRGSRIVQDEGACKTFICPYHNWTYATDGRLIATPLIDENEHLQHADLSLLEVRMEAWAGFLFVTFDEGAGDEDAGPLADWLGDLPANCTPYDPDSMVCTRRVTWDVKANWKLHFENFNDSLHIPFVHGSTLYRQAVSGRKRAGHEETDGQYITHFTSHQGSRGLMDGETGLPPIETLTGRLAEGTYYPCIYPTTMMAWTIDCMWIFELHPKGPEAMQVVGTSFFPEDRVGRDDFAELTERYYHRMDIVLPEDNAAVENQQQGLHAPKQASSHFTHMETLCHAFDNWVLDRVLADDG